MQRILGRIVVGMTLFLIGFIAYSSQIFIIWPWYGRALSIPLLTLLVPFNTLVGLLLWNYWLCVTTNPGTVPDGWAPDTDALEGYEVKKLTGNPRYCRTCNKYKPPRAHHCKTCKQCVLRMADHHCPWVNNCVGFYNYGHFIRFLFFVDVACSYHTAMVTTRVLEAMDKPYYEGPETTEFIFIVLNYATCIPVLIMVGLFSLYHFYCLLGNSTTIEGWEKDKVATLIRRGKIREIKFPYNLGWERNIKAVLGPHPLMWCCPTIPPGTGLKFQLSDTEGIESQEQWPPRDPSAPLHDFRLSESPWTYNNGSVNPSLEPSNSARRRRPQAAAVPPYHPDYQEAYDSTSEDNDGDATMNRWMGRARRGSEGYEVQAIDREEILRQYVASRGADVGRYKRYVPQPPSESSSDGEETLAERIETWRAGEAIC
ncbi:zf-DHHC-domain-containing protein [Vararia minispora EC-137]|uniref:Zf-DHHC-domain-containing protein n=1 Tax=Vararia minispora EC-137 TaxID=1314806 RepID=A0ACB8QQM0_9AGAM|nr:zf-DHHC-domain-containing protein [Vararia minispora EC-137]